MTWARTASSAGVDGVRATGSGVPLDLQPLHFLAHLPRRQADERMGIRRYATPGNRPGGGDRESPLLRQTEGVDQWGSEAFTYPFCSSAVSSC